jgi:hypothetical protein
MERISGLEELNTNFLSGANQLSIETGKRHAFVHSQIQISSIVNGEAMLICQREHSVIGRRLDQPYVQVIREAGNSSVSGLLILPRRKPIRTLFRIS